MRTNFESYDQFSDYMIGQYPDMFKRYGGFDIGKGWYPIVDSLCNRIHHHVKWVNDRRERLLKENPHDLNIPNEIAPVVVDQVKEKFGGLRFYYTGGDDVVDGMVRMAESWAAQACEECGKPAHIRSEGWIRTLCDEHEEIRQQQMKERLA